MLQYQHVTCYPTSMKQSIIFSTIMFNEELKIHISIAKKLEENKQKQSKSQGDP